MPLVFNPQSFVGLVSWLVSILPELSPHQSERMVSDTFSTTSNVINEADGTNRPKSEIDRSLRQSIVHNNGVSEFDWLTHLDKGIWPPGDLFSEIKHSTGFVFTAMQSKYLFTHFRSFCSIRYISRRIVAKSAIVAVRTKHSEGRQ